MREHGDLGRFLECYPQFSFDIIEHIHATAIIEEARARLEAFVAGVTDASADTSPWQRQRQAIKTATAGVEAYDGIDWTRQDYEATIPLIDKSALRAAPEAFLKAGLDRENLWTRPTSGTSGPPVTVYYDARAFAELQYFSACTALCYSGLIRKALDGRPIFALAVLDNNYLQDRIWLDPSGLTGATLRVVFDTLSVNASAQMAYLVREHRPAVLTLKPNILSIALESLGPRCRDLGKGLIAIISGGADMSETLRREAELRIGVPVVDAYGMSEIGGIASSCTSGHGLHIHENALICEVRDEDGALRQTGRGELVISSVGNRAMPMLRYRTGDLAEVTDEPCICGKPGRRIRRLMGRHAPSFKVASGGYFAPTNLNRLFHDFPLREIQVTQRSLETIELKVEFMQYAQAEQIILLRSAAESIINERFNLTIETTTFPKDDKFQRYRSFI